MDLRRDRSRSPEPVEIVVYRRCIVCHELTYIRKGRCVNPRCPLFMGYGHF